MDNKYLRARLNDAEERNDVLTAIVSALLSRSEGVLILTRAEVEAAWPKKFKYHLTSGDAMLIERT